MSPARSTTTPAPYSLGMKSGSLGWAAQGGGPAAERVGPELRLQRFPRRFFSYPGDGHHGFVVAGNHVNEDLFHRHGGIGGDGGWLRGAECHRRFHAGSAPR